VIVIPSKARDLLSDDPRKKQIPRYARNDNRLGDSAAISSRVLTSLITHKLPDANIFLDPQSFRTIIRAAES
jgi:hypothetical protein